MPPPSPAARYVIDVTVSEPSSYEVSVCAPVGEVSTIGRSDAGLNVVDAGRPFASTVERTSPVLKSNVALTLTCLKGSDAEPRIFDSGKAYCVLTVKTFVVCSQQEVLVVTRLPVMLYCLFYT